MREKLGEEGANVALSKSGVKHICKGKERRTTIVLDLGI